MQSLLGQFYNRIKGSQEDIASEGLVYILQQSIESRRIINQVVKINTDITFPDLLYQTQNAGKEKERPDISGKDDKGNEVLLIEAKFWASLTENQPNGYLKRLKEDSVLIFLVPTLRARTIFDEIKNRLLVEDKDVEIDSENLKFVIKPSNQHVLIKTWNEILNSIKLKIEQINNITLLSDLNQIIGLCEIIDKNSFQPITNEDLSPKIPKNINSYYEIVDKVVDELKNLDEEISTKGLIKTPQRYGYHRYFTTKGLGMNFSLKLDLWEKCADTPFWLGIAKIDDKNWILDNDLKNKVETVTIKQNLPIVFYANGNGVFIGLRPTLYETEDIVIKDFANNIKTIIEGITTANSQ